jgi:hypothetical protein
MAIICSREIKALAAVQFTGFNHCEVMDIISECYYWGIHKTAKGVEIIWQVTDESPLLKALVPVGWVVMENRRGGISVMSDAAYKSEFIGCC